MRCYICKVDAISIVPEFMRYWAAMLKQLPVKAAPYCVLPGHPLFFTMVSYVAASWDLILTSTCFIILMLLIRKNPYQL